MLSNKTTFITGAGSGIGRASALRFAKEGAKVYVCDINEEGLKETVQLIRTQVPQCQVKHRVLDVSIDADVGSAVADCVKELQGIDVAFANAGIVGMPIPFWELDESSILNVMKVSILGVLYVFKHASLKMKELGDTRGGSLIATSSVAGLRSGAGDSIYSASKAAVISLCQTCANQLTGTNIRVNAIAPGLIETGMTKPVFDMADQRNTRHKIGQLNPMLRYGVPEEISGAALFLASDLSSYTNGQVIPVCGGLSSSHPVAGRVKGKVSS